MEKRGKTDRNLSELRNIFASGMCFAVNLIFQYIPVSGLMLQEEALIISKRLGEDSMGFSASNGWLSK